MRWFASVRATSERPSREGGHRRHRSCPGDRQGNRREDGRLGAFHGGRRRYRSRIGSPGQITPVQVDLTTTDGPLTVRKEVEDTGLPLLGLVNNAGITRDARLIMMTDEDFRPVLDVNTGAAYRLSTELALS